MSQPSSLEQRVKLLESEVAALKKLLGGEPTGDNWIEKITGTFAGDAEFAEIVKLGAKLRREDRPSES